MIFTILLVLLTHLIVPAWLIVTLLFFDTSVSQIELSLALLCYGSYSMSIFLLGNWSWVGYGWRYVFLGLFVIAAIKSTLSLTTLTLWTTPTTNQWVNLIIYGFLLALFLTQSVEGLKARAIPKSPISLDFPLKQGSYYIGHGGSTKSANHHHPSEAQRFALDILKVNRWGIRAAGLYPVELEKYEIFEDNIYSPCDGEVVQVTDGLADQIPPKSDRQNLAGNNIAIKYKNHLVLLAHMKQDSIVVKAGDLIKTGQLLGKVGNSGNTSEPHLHIHAVTGEDLDDVLKGIGIPIVFNKKFLVRNALVKT